MGYLSGFGVSTGETVKFTITMKSVVKSTLFFAVMLSMAVGCQSKKAESESSAAMTDTATIVESETIVSGDSATMMTDTTKVVMPDSTKK